MRGSGRDTHPVSAQRSAYNEGQDNEGQDNEGMERL
jgi:hypothetical protein